RPGWCLRSRPTARQQTAYPRRASRRRSFSRPPGRRSSRSTQRRSYRLPTPIDTKVGWIGTGRMGFTMARRLAPEGCKLTAWNRTRARAEPLAQDGARIADSLADLTGCDVVFCMLATWDDVKHVIAGPGGLLSHRMQMPRTIVECSSISVQGST